MTDDDATTQPQQHVDEDENTTPDPEAQPDPIPPAPQPVPHPKSAHRIAAAALIAAVIALTGIGSITQRLDALDARLSTPDLYSPPADLNTFIQTVQESVVVIECKDAQGSGWVLDLGAPGEAASEEAVALDKKFPTEVITNHHVIEDCVDTPGKVKATAFDETYDAWLYSWDAENDLALVAIKQRVPALEIALEPRPGYWAMAVGAPYGLEGSVSFGNVMNTDELEVISTAPLNSGNSGGPLVNSRGRVVGINSWVAIGDDYPQDWNVAMAIPALCVELVDCDDDVAWTWGRNIVVPG